MELTDQLRRDLDRYADHLARYGRARGNDSNSGEVRSTPRDHAVDLDDLEDLADDDQLGNILVDLLKQVEEHIRHYCETVDRRLIHDGAREENLWKVRNFLNLHVLGGRMDTLVDRVH